MSSLHRQACTAGFLLGRPIIFVSIRADRTSKGRAGVATVKNPDFDQAIEDCIVCLIADLAAGTNGLLFPLVDDAPESDEAAAFTIASEAAVGPGEIRALVDLARARALQLLEAADFRLLTEALSTRLLAEHELDGAAVEDLFLEQLEAREMRAFVEE